MRVLNRTAITLIGTQPYVEWMRARDSDFNKGTLTVARSKTYGSAFLLPEFELEEELHEWVEENFSWLFEFQLSAWTTDESAWPTDRSLTAFRQWFRVEVHSIVVDASADDLEGDEL
jgi:hypothetical protein